MQPTFIIRKTNPDPNVFPLTSEERQNWLNESRENRDQYHLLLKEEAQKVKDSYNNRLLLGIPTELEADDGFIYEIEDGELVLAGIDEDSYTETLIQPNSNTIFPIYPTNTSTPKKDVVISADKINRIYAGGSKLSSTSAPFRVTIGLIEAPYVCMLTANSLDVFTGLTEIKIEQHKAEIAYDYIYELLKRHKEELLNNNHGKTAEGKN